MNINATLLVQMIAFGALIWFTMKFIWPPLINAIDERSQKIADGLAAADKARSELASAKDGGDLGAIRLSDMAPDMRELLINLTPGQVSRVTESSDSVQFFQVLTINTDGQFHFPPYELASSSIHDRLFQEEMKNRLENWMKELREQAMIKELD